MTTTASAGHYVYIERERSAELWVGPHPTKEAAEHAPSHALLIDGFCEDEALDARVFGDSYVSADGEVVLVDLDDPDHTGAPQPAADEHAPALRLMSVPEPRLGGRSHGNEDFGVPGHDGHVTPAFGPLAAAVESRERSWRVERMHWVGG